MNISLNALGASVIQKLDRRGQQPVKIRMRPRVVDIPVVLGARGSPLTVGTHVFFRLGLNGRASVVTWSLGATVAGIASARSVTLDVRVGTTLATVASICGTGLPALATQAELNDQSPAGWSTTVIADPSTVLITVTAADGVIEVAGLTLRVAVSPR